MSIAAPSSSIPQLGFVGLGSLGSSIAKRLMSEKIALAIWNRSPDKMKSLASQGATPCVSLDQLCQRSDWVLSCVSDDAAMQQVNTALVRSTKTPLVHLSFSSCTPNAVQMAAKRAHAHDMVFLNCPVLGRPDVVAKGIATYLIAGDQASADAAEPLFSALGSNSRYLGTAPERSATIKLAMNYFIAITIGGLTEIASTLEQQQVGMDDFLNVLANSPAGSALTGLFGQLITNQKFKPALFNLQLAQKDIGYFTGLTNDNPNFFLATGLKNHMQATQASTADPIDWSGLAFHLLKKP